MAADALDHRTTLARLQSAFLTGVGGADPRSPVPACGDWRVHDLVLHLAGVHRWAAGKVRGERVSDVVDPAGRDLAAVYADAAAELRATLDDVPPGRTVRTLTGDGPASFWHRRQVHETLVHLHDLRAAALRSGPDAAAALALVLWRRLTSTRAGLRVGGDPTALDDALAAPIVP